MWSLFIDLVFCQMQNARCGAEQTQTVTRQSSTITIAPVQGKIIKKLEFVLYVFNFQIMLFEWFLT